VAPAPARAAAIARPMPRPPPVTKACLPASAISLPVENRAADENILSLKCRCFKLVDKMF
jgi:hypothetical protein